MRSKWLFIALASVLLLLTGCTSQESAVPGLQEGTGFEFVVNPEAGQVRMVPHTGGRFVPTAEGPRPLIPGRELTLAHYDYEFLPGNVLEIYASFRNNTTDTYFMDPFFFTPSLTPEQGNYESSVEPFVWEPYHLGNSSLSPGEATLDHYWGDPWFTFEVTHKGQPFSYFVDVNAAVGDLLDVIGAGEPLLQNGKEVYVGSSRPVEEFYEWCGFTMLRYLPSGDLDPAFGTGGIVTSRFGCDTFQGDFFNAGGSLQSAHHILVGGVYSGLPPDTYGFLMRFDPDGAELVREDYYGPVGVGEILPDDKVVVLVNSGFPYWVDFRSYRHPDLSGIGHVTAGDPITLPDGGVLYAGENWERGPDRDIVLVRHAPNGNLDTNFGGDGFVVINVGGDEQSPEVDPQADGSLVVTGHSSACPGGDWINFLVEVAANGSYDPPVCIP